MAWDARDDGPACALINCCQERHCMARAAPAAAAMWMLPHPVAAAAVLLLMALFDCRCCKLLMHYYNFDSAWAAARSQ